MAGLPPRALWPAFTFGNAAKGGFAFMPRRLADAVFLLALSLRCAGIYYYSFCAIYYVVLAALAAATSAGHAARRYAPMRR